jgi:hypothetical protein
MLSQTAAATSTSAIATDAGSPHSSRGRIWAAATLISIGAASLAIRTLGVTPAGGGVIVLALGVAFLTAHLVTREYGLLVPGGILTGLGAGFVASQQLVVADSVGSGLVVLGLGLGFVSIWVIGGLLRVARHHWWPLVPGGILAVIGGSLVLGGQAVQVLEFWPLVLVGAGVLVLARARVAAGTGA